MFGEVFVGIDLGGSKARFGFFDCYGNRLLSDLVVGHNGRELINDNLADELTNGINGLWERLDKLDNINKNGAFSYALNAIGLGSPGPLDPNKGIIENPPNLPQINNLNISEILQRRFGVPVFLLNDADAATIGEYAFGAGKGFKNVVMLTLGTGIGSGVIAGGRLQRGMGRGPEWGHTTMADFHLRVCDCGRMGCIEAYIGTRGLHKTLEEFCGTAQRHFQCQQNLVPFHKLVDEHLKWGMDEVAPRLKQGVADKCQICETVLERYAGYLSSAIGNISCVHNPECVVLGGGIANIGQPLLDALNRHLNWRTDKMKGLLIGMQIKFALLPDAGVVGAAKYAADSKPDYMQNKRE